MQTGPKEHLDDPVGEPKTYKLQSRHAAKIARMNISLINSRCTKYLLLSLLLASIVMTAGVSAQRRAKGPGSNLPATVVTEIDAAKWKELLHREPPAANPLLINFWATWCEPCREEYPDLVKIDSQFKDKGLDFITVSLDDVDDIKTKVPEFLKDMRAKMPAYLLNTPEPETAIAAVDKDWSGSLPATFLLNSKGEVVYSHQGKIKPEELSAEIQKVTGEK